MAMRSRDSDAPRTLRFADRVQAGRALAQALVERGVRRDCVLGIPRGGVPVAAEVARALNISLDVVVAKKIGAPFQPEFALGAVTAGGIEVLQVDALDDAAGDPAWLEDAARRARATAVEKEMRLRAGREPLDVRGRSVVLVDDGLATGATALACVRDLRARGAASVTLAVPVGSREACARLEREVDRLVCLARPPGFLAVGDHYGDFTQVSDAEAGALLRAAASA